MFLLNRKKKNSVRYQFDFTIHGLDRDVASQLPPNAVSISWKRGNKTGETSKLFPSDKGVNWDWKMSFSTRLEKVKGKTGANGTEVYKEKTIRFVLREDASKSHTREVARANVDLAPLASNNAVLQSKRVILSKKDTRIPILVSVSTTRVASKKAGKSSSGDGAGSSRTRGGDGKDHGSEDGDSHSAVSTSASYMTTSEAATEDSEDGEVIDLTMNDSSSATLFYAQSSPNGDNQNDNDIDSPNPEPVDLPDTNDADITSSQATTTTTTTKTSPAKTSPPGSKSPNSVLSVKVPAEIDTPPVDSPNSQAPVSPREHLDSADTRASINTSRSVTPVSFNNEDVISNLIQQNPEWRSFHRESVSPSSDGDGSRRSSIPFEVIEDTVLHSTSPPSAAPKGHARRASVAHFPERAPISKPAPSSGLATQPPTNAKEINESSRTEVFLAEIDRLKRSAAESRQGFDRQKHELTSLRTELSRRVSDLRLLRLLEHTIYRSPIHDGPYIPMPPVVMMKSLIHWKAFEDANNTSSGPGRLSDAGPSATSSGPAMHAYLTKILDAFQSQINLVKASSPLLASKMCDIVTLHALIERKVKQDAGGLVIKRAGDSGEGADPIQQFESGLADVTTATYTALVSNARALIQQHGDQITASIRQSGHDLNAASNASAGASKKITRTLIELFIALYQQLTAAHALLPKLCVSVLTAAVSTVNGIIMNFVLEHDEVCTMSGGLRIKMVVAQLSDWLGEYQNGVLADTVDALGPARQTADVLVMNKAAFEDAQTHKDVCPSLSILQLKHVLTLYRGEEECPETVPATTLEAIAQRYQDENHKGRPGHAELLFDLSKTRAVTPPDDLLFALSASLDVSNLVVPEELSGLPEFAFLGFSIG